MRSAVALLTVLVLAGCLGPSGPPASTPPPPPPVSPEPTPPPGNPGFRLERMMTGLERPVWLEDARDGRFFIVEQAGRVRTWKDGALLAKPFLDIRDLVASDGEQGLLSIALDPGFATNGKVIVSYTDKLGDSVIARYRVGGDPDALDPASARVLLKVDQPFANHNGGLGIFGPDGMYYFGFGDGGSGGDPLGNGQSKATLLGKLLRIDVRGDGDYAVPSDNPFAGQGPLGTLPTSDKAEIWAYGLRNPWRFSFDRATGDLFIADVGQNRMEEVNFASHASRGGENYGWNIWEGSTRFRSGDTNGPATFPVAEYDHGTGGCSVTGGYVYRGDANPSLKGVYLYADYCSGVVWGLWSDGASWVSRELAKPGFRISSFAEDARGELYVLDHGGAVWRVTEP